MDYSFHTLDVFTNERFGGNPLAVVMAAEGLTSAEMQQIAREFNLSETVFVLPAERPAHSARLRIFTPGRELPFAGHPTVGAAILLAEVSGRIGDAGDALMVLEEGIGSVRVGVRKLPGEPAYAEFDIPKLPEPLDGPAPPDRIAAALGLAPNEISFENHRPTRYSAGVPFCFVPVRDLETIARARPMAQHWPEAFGDIGAAFLYCRETARTRSAFHARMFAPGLGVQEDPATGSAVAAFSAAVMRFDALTEGEHRLAIEQGYEMGRPSTIILEIAVAGTHLKNVRIGGHAVPVSRGTISV